MTRRLAAILAALLVAATGGIGVIAYARAADARALAGQEAVRAFVADRLVPAGTTAGRAVQEGLIVPRLIARRAVPDGALVDTGSGLADGVGELVATSTIQPGELVLRARFAARGTTPGALLVPEGMLAISVLLDDPSHVGAFVTVGSKVAVLDTFDIRETGAVGEAGAVPALPVAVPAGDRLAERHEYVRATKVLVPSVEVLAVGTGTTAASTAVAGVQKASAGLAAGAGGDDGALFTLAVTQAQAEKLVHAARTGTLTFALLGPRSTLTPDHGVDDRSLFEVTK